MPETLMLSEVLQLILTMTSDRVVEGRKLHGESRSVNENRDLINLEM